MRKFFVCMAMVAVLSAVAAPAAEAASGPKAGLRGWARLDPHSAVPGADRLTLAVDARARHRIDGGGSSEAWGHATIQHEFPNEDGTTSTVRIEVDVDCLTAGGPISGITGTIESLTFIVPPGHTQPPAASDSWHPETGFSFYADGSGQRRVGWAKLPDYRDPTAPPTTAKCAAPAATADDLYLVEGGFARRR